MKSSREAADPIPVSARHVAAFRLGRHHLATRATAADLPRVAGDMAGAQAQVLSAAQMSLWARTRGIRREDVDRALWGDRTIVKAWCMRGSLHLIPSIDFATFVRGSARREARSLAWLEREGLPIDPINRIVEAIPQVLDRPRTRKEIAERMSDAFRVERKRKAGRGWGGPSDADGFVVGRSVLSVSWIIYVACMRALACFGPMRGNETTFVRPDRWLPDWRDRPQEESEVELLRRYLRAHGPATVADFALWAYLKAADAREIWARLEDKLSPVTVDGRLGWMLREDLAALQRADLDSPNVRLLPFFDSFLLGLKDKGHLIDAAHYKRVYRPQGWLAPVVLVDGRVVGVWGHERRGRILSVDVEGFRPLSSTVRARIEGEADDLGRFLGVEEVRPRFRVARGATGPPRKTGAERAGP